MVKSNMGMKKVRVSLGSVNLCGFTLVELMISVLILGIGLTSVGNSYRLALRGANAARNNVAALVIAKEKFENLQFASLKGAEPFSWAPEIIKSLNQDYIYQEEVAQIAGKSEMAKYLVSACLTVSYREKNSLKNVTLATYLPQLVIPAEAGI